MSFASTPRLPAGFSKNESWVTGLSQPATFAQAPDGRIFVCEKGGRLRVIKNGALLPTPFHQFTVDNTGERGLIGVAFHPDFASNGYVYAHYTATTPTTHNRISRLVANGDVSTGAETAIVDLPTLSNALIHNGGAIHFGPDGKLYAAVGDNGVGTNAQNLALVFGKMLRFNDDGTIPTDNPFYGSQTGLARAVWAYGLRNPFTFAFQPGTGRMHINDVGRDNLGGDRPRHGRRELRLARIRGTRSCHGRDHRAPVHLQPQRRQPARVGARGVPGRRVDHRRRVLSGQRQLPRGVPKQLLLRRLRQALGQPARHGERGRRLRLRDNRRRAGQRPRGGRRGPLRADAAGFDHADQRALNSAGCVPTDTSTASSNCTGARSRRRRRTPRHYGPRPQRGVSAACASRECSRSLLCACR